MLSAVNTSIDHGCFQFAAVVTQIARLFNRFFMAANLITQKNFS